MIPNMEELLNQIKNPAVRQALQELSQALLAPSPAPRKTPSTPTLVVTTAGGDEEEWTGVEHEILEGALQIKREGKVVALYPPGWNSIKWR